MRDGRRPTEPIIKRMVGSDSSSADIDPQITGHDPLPGALGVYRLMMTHDVCTYRLLNIGGLTSRNWIRLECISENWQPREEPPLVAEVWEIAGMDSSMADHHPVDDQTRRCGGKGADKLTAQETHGRLIITQEVYGAKTKYDKATRKIDIPVTPLGGGGSYRL